MLDTHLNLHSRACGWRCSIIENMRTHRTDTAAAQRCSRNRKAAKHFCPVPMSGAPNGGYCEVKGGTGRPGRDIGPPSQTRWFYGGREAAGLSDADTWEY